MSIYKTIPRTMLIVCIAWMNASTHYYLGTQMLLCTMVIVNGMPTAGSAISGPDIARSEGSLTA